MIVTHLCLNNFYVENMEYQENVLPRKHKELGHDVEIITSVYAFNSAGEKQERETGSYFNKDGIKVTILPYKSKNKYLKSFGLFSGLKMKLFKIKPDVIFVHGGHFLSILDVISYKRKNKETKIIVDQHGDYINSPITTWKEKIVRKGLWRFITKITEKYVNKYWGVTPLRVEYLQKVYKVKPEKTGLLVMGGDEKKIDYESKKKINEGLRKEFNIKDTDFLIVTGGKIDNKKNIHLLMEAVAKMDKDNMKIVIFGEPSQDMSIKIKQLSEHRNIRYVGWITPEESYNWFLSADLVVFPGTHSVLWEQALATGTPCVFKYWEGMEHVDIGGNCKFLFRDSSDEIIELLDYIIGNKQVYEDMKRNSIEAIKTFSYIDIAKRALII